MMKKNRNYKYKKISNVEIRVSRFERFKIKMLEKRTNDVLLNTVIC